MTRAVPATGLRIKIRRRLPRIEGAESELELRLLNRIARHGLPRPATQVQILEDRRFRYDIAWPAYKVAVEAQGGVWARRGSKKCLMCGETPRGRHTGAGFESDAEKGALAQIRGWIVLAVTPGMLDTDLGMRLIEEALRARGWGKVLL